MKFSVVTPSFRSRKWLELCAASIADQKVPLEHIVQDSCSDDGTGNWLANNPRIKAFVEKDTGMYDAVNRGLKRATGDVLSYLNCDEQYLPGALERVDAFFEQNPSIELLFGDVIIVNPAGEYLCHRKSMIPLKAHSMVSNNLSTLTCATFFRKSLLEKRGLFFNAQLRDLGDADWAVRCVDQKVPMALLHGFTSTFTDTGENMNLKPNARKEQRALFDSAPAWARKMHKAVIAHHRMRKWLTSGYTQPPFEYSIFTASSSSTRKTFRVEQPTARFVRYTPGT